MSYHFAVGFYNGKSRHRSRKRSKACEQFTIPQGLAFVGAAFRGGPAFWLLYWPLFWLCPIRAVIPSAVEGSLFDISTRHRLTRIPRRGSFRGSTGTPACARRSPHREQTARASGYPGSGVSSPSLIAPLATSPSRCHPERSEGSAFHLYRRQPAVWCPRFAVGFLSL